MSLDDKANAGFTRKLSLNKQETHHTSSKI